MKFWKWILSRWYGNHNNSPTEEEMLERHNSLYGEPLDYFPQK